MDFLLEPIINIDTELLPADKDVASAACCSSGSGCSSGMSTNVDTKEL